MFSNEINIFLRKAQITTCSNIVLPWYTSAIKVLNHLPLASCLTISFSKDSPSSSLPGTTCKGIKAYLETCYWKFNKCPEKNSDFGLLHNESMGNEMPTLSKELPMN